MTENTGPDKSNANAPQTILLVGATGILGSRIAHHLLEQPGARPVACPRHRKQEERARSPVGQGRGNHRGRSRYRRYGMDKLPGLDQLALRPSS